MDKKKLQYGKRSCTVIKETTMQIPLVRTKRLSLLIFPILIFFILLMVFILPRKDSQTTSQNKGKEKTKVKSQTVLAPSVYFEEYDNKTLLPYLPPSLSTYKLKDNYSLAEAQTIANQFGLTQYKEDNDKKYITFYNFSDPSYMGIMTFKTSNGALTFRSYGNHILPNIPGTTNQKVYEYLLTLGLADSTVSCETSYKRNAEIIENTTFYECHRDWSKAGLAILNPVGILNLPENQSLTSLKQGIVENDGPIDPSITATSTGQDGKARPNDFNTITVAIENGERIVAIESNLRKIISTRQLDTYEVLSPSEAMQMLQNHESALSLTIPAGAGTLSWSAVYPNNIAEAKIAEITDFFLSYIEKPVDQTQQVLTPMYIARGKATLSSGYTVRFIELIPAERDGTLIFAQKKQSVAGAKTRYLAQAATDSLQLLPYYPTGTIIPSPTQIQSGEITFPTPTPKPDAFRCIPPGVQEADQEVTLQVPGLGNMVVRVNPYGSAHKFYYISSDFGPTSLDEVKLAFYKVISAQYIELMSTRFSSSTFTNTQNINDMYGFFSTFNSQPYCDLANNAPPLPGCPTKFEISSGGYEIYVDQERVKYIAEYTANTLLEAKKNNTLTNLATGKQYFPTQTLNNFGYIFLEYTENSKKQQESYPGGNNSFSCYITGVSPALFFYSPKDIDFSISLPNSTSYTYPATENNTWSVNLKSNQLTTYNSRHFAEVSPLVGQPTTNNYLYYEYDQKQVQFAEPSEAFVIKRSEWKNWLDNIFAKQAGLTTNERERLSLDIKQALTNLHSSEYLSVYLADKNEVNKNLPLVISPKPRQVYRLHLLMKPLQTLRNTEQPIIPVIDRSEFTVVEVGARALE